MLPLLLVLLAPAAAVPTAASHGAITYTKYPNTDSRLGAAKPGACADGCQSLRCGATKPCGKIGCAGAGPDPCNITELQDACTADPQCGGFNSDGWLKPCVSASCGAVHMKHSGVDTYASSRSPLPPAPPPVDTLPSVEDWHYPREEKSEMEDLLSLNLHVTMLHVTSNTTGTLTARVANGSTASVSVFGDRLFGWQLRGFLIDGGDGTPLAVLRHDAQRWGLVAFLAEGSRLSTLEPAGDSGGLVLRKGVGRIDAVRRPHYNLVNVDNDYFHNAVIDARDFLRQGMQHSSAFNETTFVAAASRLPPAHDYAIVGNINSHTKFSIAQDGRVKLANFSIYSPTLLGNVTDAGRDTHFGGGPMGTVLLFDPRLYLSWWPEHNFSDYKTSIVGRYTRAVTLAAWDQTQQYGFGMTVVPNTQRGIETSPYDTAELLIELEEHGASARCDCFCVAEPIVSVVIGNAHRSLLTGRLGVCCFRYFAVRACVTVGSNVPPSACLGVNDCRDFTRCSAPEDSTAVELTKPGEGAALFHANLRKHCSEWHDLFQGGGVNWPLLCAVFHAAF